MTASALDLRGRVFSRWTVLEPAPSRGHGARWMCRCNCGTERDVAADSLLRGASRSCRCLQRELSAADPHHVTHGLSGSREYSSYKAMVGRCCDPEHTAWKWYGALGVVVCDRWLGPDGVSNFFADMAPRPPGRSLDRIDPFGNYEPTNCRWATPAEQANNKRSTNPRRENR